MKTEDMTAQDAIRFSAAENRIVHIAALRTIQAELCAACEDWTDAGTDEAGAVIYEYWGTDDGREWRVHAHGATGH